MGDVEPSSSAEPSPSEQKPEYERPAVEDLDGSEGASMTAAGVTNVIG